MGEDSSAAGSMINARAETAATKPAFRDALKARGCLIPADGFYEWMRTGKAKQPFCFEVNEGQLFTFAGIWGRIGWLHNSLRMLKAQRVGNVVYEDEYQVVAEPFADMTC